MKLEDIKARCTLCPDCEANWRWAGHPATAAHRVAVQIDGKRHLVRRTIFELHTGRPVKKGYCVITECSGDKCMNPELLREITKKALLKRQIEEGRIHNAAHKAKVARARRERDCKLGPEKAMEVYLAEGDFKDIAAKHGVSRQAVGQIKSQKTYRYIHNNPFQGLMR